jgi:hypothetical protein
MIKKEFDCVEMKHKAAKDITEKISVLSPADELAFWERSNKELIERKNAIKIKHAPGKAKNNHIEYLS